MKPRLTTALGALALLGTGTLGRAHAPQTAPTPAVANCPRGRSVSAAGRRRRRRCPVWREPSSSALHLTILTLGVTGVVLFIVMLAASWLPARRAARISPVSAMRV